MRAPFIVFAVGSLSLVAVLGIFLTPHAWLLLLVVAPLVTLGVVDMAQSKHAIRRNFPLLGRFRYGLEMIRPEIQQYFIESNTDGRPFSREQRSVIYQRSKRVTDTVPFGTQEKVYEIGYEWVNHSLAPKHVSPDDMRVVVGGPQCKKPYSASVFNISAMSYGALSRNAILALNGGAKIGGFYHDTGEGGLSPYHLEPGGDIVWEIGTGYFGCRSADGRFDADKFKEKAALPAVKMIEIKLSQGAKPSHGGILPAAKVTPEIAQIRGVEMGKDVLSPPAHREFDSPRGLLEFVARLRELSGGKPVGFKLCIGKRREFLAICKAIVATGIMPDFIAVDGGEGGTGAAPLEFANSVGCPLREGLIFVHNALTGINVRQHVRVIASGKVMSGFDIINRLAIGADICNSARGMMMALGCIQALRCNSNHCPTGVATQNPALVVGLDVTDKRVRVANYQRETVKSAAEMMGAMGVRSTSELRPWHVMKRTGLAETRHYGELFEYIPAGSLLGKDVPASFARAYAAATPESFDSVEDLARAERTLRKA
jgi:glutamate synthase domain-containing protein 2